MNIVMLICSKSFRGKIDPLKQFYGWNLFRWSRKVDEKLKLATNLPNFLKVAKVNDIRLSKSYLFGKHSTITLSFRIPLPYKIENNWRMTNEADFQLTDTIKCLEEIWLALNIEKKLKKDRQTFYEKISNFRKNR